jgi:hypothetical protein
MPRGERGRLRLQSSLSRKPPLFVFSRATRHTKKNCGRRRFGGKGRILLAGAQPDNF